MSGGVSPCTPIPIVAQDGSVLCGPAASSPPGSHAPSQWPFKTHRSFAGRLLLHGPALVPYPGRRSRRFGSLRAARFLSARTSRRRPEQALTHVFCSRCDFREARSLEDHNINREESLFGLTRAPDRRWRPTPSNPSPTWAFRTPCISGLNLTHFHDFRILSQKVSSCPVGTRWILKIDRRFPFIFK